MQCDANNGPSPRAIREPDGLCIPSAHPILDRLRTLEGAMLTKRNALLSIAAGMQSDDPRARQNGVEFTTRWIMSLRDRATDVALYRSLKPLMRTARVEFDPARLFSDVIYVGAEAFDFIKSPFDWVRGGMHLSCRNVKHGAVVVDGESKSCAANLPTIISHERDHLRFDVLRRFLWNNLGPKEIGPPEVFASGLFAEVGGYNWNARNGRDWNEIERLLCKSPSYLRYWLRCSGIAHPTAVHLRQGQAAVKATCQIAREFQHAAVPPDDVTLVLAAAKNVAALVKAWGQMQSQQLKELAGRCPTNLWFLRHAGPAAASNTS